MLRAVPRGDDWPRVALVRRPVGEGEGALAAGAQVDLCRVAEPAADLAGFGHIDPPTAGRALGNVEATGVTMPGLRSFAVRVLAALSGQRAVGLAAMADADDQDNELLVGDLVNDPVVTDA